MPLELPELPDKLQLQDRSQPQVSQPTSPPAVTRAEAAASQRQEEEVYTWEDGDRTLNVVLQEDLTIQKTADITSGAEWSQGGHGEHRTEAGQPDSRRSSSVPLGIGWRADDPARRRAAVAGPRVGTRPKSRASSLRTTSMDSVSELGFLPNGFLVETEPGFPSLELANSLAAQDGVAVSSPNWSTQVEAK